MSGTFQGLTTLQFSPDNKHAYAYSGIKSVNTEQTILQVTPNSEYLKCRIEIGSSVRTDDDFLARFYIDNIIIFTRYFNASYDYPEGRITDLIIPPFSTFKLTLQNQSTATARDWSAILVADVKGAIEQFDLEVNNE
jgi:hypothetical protein